MDLIQAKRKGRQLIHPGSDLNEEEWIGRLCMKMNGNLLALATSVGILVLAFSFALAYYDPYRSARLPANSTLADRDFCRAHTYRRVDREYVYHPDWTR